MHRYGSLHNVNALRAHLDFETGSAAELVGPRSVGVHRYAEDETTRIHLFSWRIGKGPKHRYHIGDEDPVELCDHIARNGIVVAHNAMFERIIWSMMKDKYKLWHWPDLKISQQRCTMAKGMVLNFPASLDMLGKVLGTTQPKDLEGAALMKKMAKPIVNKHSRELQWHDTPDNIKRLGIYCDQDIEAETWLDETLPDLSPFEQQVWELDQLINDRGIPLDLPSIMRAQDVVEYAKLRANKDMAELTDGAVKKVTEVAKIVEWINTQGIECVSFTKGDHEELLVVAGFAGNSKIEKVINLRSDASKTSVAKFLKMLECICSDGRARGQFQYAGATQTLRWAGRLIQPQNLRRIDWEKDAHIIQWTLWCLNSPLSTADMYDMIEMGVGRVLNALSLCLRGMIKAEEGHILMCADWSNIEGRLNAWLSRELWKLSAFQAYDTGTGQDLYKLAYSRSFGVAIELVGKGSQRQIGKVQELGLGYQGGVGAVLKMCKTYYVQPYTLVEPVRAATHPELWAKVASGYASATDKHDLFIDIWTAVKIIVNNWRKDNPAIVASWYEIEDAAVGAVSNPGHVFQFYNGRGRYLCDGNNLYCQLPDGSTINYPQVSLRYMQTEYVMVNDTWVNTDEFWEFELDVMRQAGAQFKKRGKNTVFFYGIDQETGQWREQYLYGGHQVENFIQATAAQVLRRGMLKIESAGYPIILHAHDEILAHVPIGYGSLNHFKSLMLIDEPWLQGCPLSVTAFEDERYVK